MKPIKSIILAASLLAYTNAGAENVSNIRLERSQTNLIVDLNLDIASIPRSINRETWLRPVILSATSSDSLELRPVLVAGHNRYYRHLRNDSRPDYMLVKAGSTKNVDYNEVVKYIPWMEKATLVMREETDGCCGDRIGESTSRELAVLDFTPRVFVPVYLYVRPEAEAVKVRSVSGSAFIDFKVSSTAIDPAYRSNPRELAEIRKTIDAVKNDADVTITSLSVKGYASPEGPWNLNERLAQGRTESLVTYVRDLYSFPADLMHTSWQAEDWDGLIAWLQKSDIADKDAILEIAQDNSLKPDDREWRLKSRYPQQYAMLLADVYPSLRHSDYNVTYNVRNYATVDEIAAIMATAPQKLSLGELFTLAQSLDKNSPEFREVMEVAVRMFPDSPVANLNAASTAIAHDEFDMARKYLAKAGNGPETLYAQGIIAAREAADYESARTLFARAAAAGIAEAQAAIEQLKELELIK
ncbi:MAG: hypothetical protein K2I18_03470 [Paramuribaculum sp.]|nr:hypothetical protein [Paramuribaculum sp.]